MSPIRLLPLALLAACPAEDQVAVDDTDADTAEEAGPTAFAHCNYANPFSSDPECKEYVGEGWDEATAKADCDAPLLTAPAGELVLGSGCDDDPILGWCYLAEGEPDATTLVFPGDDPDACGGAETGCGFGGGRFEPSEVCDGSGGGGGSAIPTFQPFELVCVDPVAGEAPGDGPDGQVCTWEAISGATEEGRKFVDYADCATVLTQRPYAPYEVTANTSPDDPRLSDEDWLAEYAWVTEQVEATACVCCHSSELAPNGASGWYLEADPIWIDTLDDDGLAMLAGWVDSTAFGAFPPEDNNGFDRETTGLPTTDVARMQAFLEGELARRGFTASDFAQTEPFGGPLYDQLFYEPEACRDGQGIAANGTLSWTGGGARYVYVLEPDSMAPGVPPNLDTPDGTLWRVDVKPDDEPLETGLVYGTAAGATQKVPESGQPPALDTGETYYLYVLRDVYQPITRCLATVE